MAKVKFTVACTAMYHSELEIPDEIKNNEEEVLQYIRENLDQCPVDELEWLNDFEPNDAVTMEDIRYIDDELTPDLILEIEDLLEFNESTNNIKISKDIFDDFIENSYINIHFVDYDIESIFQYKMISEDKDGIIMAYINSKKYKKLEQEG